MNSDPTPSPDADPAEAARLAALARFMVLDTPPEALFDRLTELAAATFAAPYAALTLVDEGRCWFKARYGLALQGVPRLDDLLRATPLVLPDAAAEPRWAHSPLVRQAGVRFYIGAPLLTHEGLPLGALSVMDRVPRPVPGPAAVSLLTHAAAAVVEALELRRAGLQTAQQQGELLEVLEAVPAYVLQADPSGALRYANRAARAALGLQKVSPFPDLSTQAGDLFTPQTRVPQGDGGSWVLAPDGSSQRQQALEGQRAEVLGLIARGAPLPAVLLHLTRFLEATQPGVLAAVSLLKEGKLHLEVAPSLPSGFVRLLEALPVAPRSGAAAAAVASRQRVLTRDIRTDPVWHNLRFTALHHGLRAALSDPILSDQGEVLGSFDLYSREVDGVGAPHQPLLREAAQLAAVAVSRQALYAQLQRQALHDPLTGLPNRTLLHDRLSQVLLQAERTHSAVGVLLLDLDNFKQVNDTLGHGAGDLLLQEVAERLRTGTRPSDTVARLGGDEFVLIAPLRAAEDVAEVAPKVLAAFRTPFVVRGRTFEIRASLGVSLYPFDGGEPEALLRAADSAMYAAKADARAGRGTGYRLYHQAMTDSLEAQLALEAGLRQALVLDEFELFVQPRLELRAGTVVSFEALLRWRSPEHGLLAPGRFLPVAEAAGLLPALDAWVLEQAVVQLGRWGRQGVPYGLSCNLSAASFRRDGFAPHLGSLLRQHKVDPARLELEITENLLMRDLGGAAEQLRDLKAQLPGIRVAIDDFGSGYSSLAYLRHLPIDTLKIDRAFVHDLGAGEPTLDELSAPDPNTPNRTLRTALAVIRTVIALGRELGFRVVAEGAETAAQLGMLTALGVDEVQGYFIGLPTPLRDVVREADGSPSNGSETKR